MNTTTEIVCFLRDQVSLFASFSEERLRQLAEGARVVSYEPNEAVVEFGEDASFSGVLLEGRSRPPSIADRGQRRGARASEGW